MNDADSLFLESTHPRNSCKRQSEQIIAIRKENKQIFLTDTNKNILYSLLPLF